MIARAQEGPLLLATRHLRGQTVAEGFHLHEIQELTRACAPLRFPNPPDFQAVGNNVHRGVGEPNHGKTHPAVRPWNDRMKITAIGRTESQKQQKKIPRT
jgi:hypothetical protein